MSFSVIDKYKNIISGCRTRDDAIYIINKLTRCLPAHEKKLVLSYIDSFDLFDFGNDSFFKILEKMDSFKYQDKCQEYFDELIKSKPDTIKTESQIKTLLRIINMKPKTAETKPRRDIGFYALTETTSKSIHSETRKCPHCGHRCRRMDGKYVICGYSDTKTGYDWTGCGKDWCFDCGKKLCKSWTKDFLFLESNRIHNKKCCMKHAKELKEDFEKEYCTCF